MELFDAKTYLAYVEYRLTSPDEKKRGVVKQLAEHLRCHQSFISQVLTGRAEFNLDHAFGFCRFFQLDDDETAYFLDLHQRDRAGDKTTRAYFDKRLKERLERRNNLKLRWGLQDTLREELEAQYFQQWLVQAIHCALLIPELNTVTTISKYLKVNESEVVEILGKLEKIGLATHKGDQWQATQNSLHLGKESPHLKIFHANWRLKTMTHIYDKNLDNGLHFTALAAITAEDAKQIKELLIKALEKSRKAMLNSESKEIHVLCLDFFGLRP